MYIYLYLRYGCWTGGPVVEARLHLHPGLAEGLEHQADLRELQAGGPGLRLHGVPIIIIIIIVVIIVIRL